MFSEKMDANEAAEIKCIITSLLISNPIRSTVQQLSKDFLAIEGRPIPFKKLGFSNLEEYLRSIPDTVCIYGSGLYAEVEGVVTSKSEHINEMVLKQKKHKSSTSHNKRGRVKSFSKFHPEQTSWRHGYKSNSLQKLPSFKESNNCCTIPTATTVDEQFCGKPIINIPSKDTPIIEENFIYNDLGNTESVAQVELDSALIDHLCQSKKNLKRLVTENVHSEELKDYNKFDKKGAEENNSCKSNCEEDTIILSSDEDCSGNVPSKIRNNLKKLMKHFPSGIECSKLPIEYKKMFNKRICYEQFNFRSLIEMCSDLPEIFRYVQQGSDDYVLYDCSKPIPSNSKLIKSSEKKYVYIENVTTTHILEELPNLNWSTASPMIPQNVFQISDKISRFFPTDIAVGDILDINIGEICDLSKFWIYMTYGEVEPLMKNLQTFYTNNRGCYLIPEVLIQEGLYCVALYSDLYHRCVIVNLLPKLKGFVRVFYIDYGTVGNVCSNQLWFLSKQFGEIPCQAIRARLSNICPIYENRPWSNAAVVKFEKLVSNRVVVAEVTRVDEKDHLLEVYLADITNEQNIFYINDLIVQDGLARYVDQEGKKVFMDVDCRPHVGYIHLYPEFYEIESGIAPITEEMKYIVAKKVPLHNYMPQYFDICYSEDTNSIQKQYELFIWKKLPDVTIPLNDKTYEFDFSYFPNSIRNEIENLFEEQKRDKKTKFKFINKSDILQDGENVAKEFREYSCNKKRITELIYGKIPKKGEIYLNNNAERYSSNTSAISTVDSELGFSEQPPDIESLNNALQELSTNSDLSVHANVFVPQTCTNPFLKEENFSQSNPFRRTVTNPFVYDIRETVNNSELFQIFAKPVDDKLSEKIINLNDAHICPCKTYKKGNLSKSNVSDDTETITLTSEISTDTKNAILPNLFKTCGKNETEISVKPRRRVRTPPGFSSISTENRMLLNNINYTNSYNHMPNNPSNNLHLRFPYSQVYNTFFVPSQFGMPMIQPNMNNYFNSIASLQFGFNTQNRQQTIFPSNSYADLNFSFQNILNRNS